ncbi:HAD family phosphatase [Spongiactinospora sp. TRM90649]|uniref:HAD family hydrolase n=1 Tax=Spongiactinospora sp. TRM90649 TaxID=3031114 RepID=UPI0023F791BF|nr:HAD family phosphatase [Spongiactinospora sp. TRM90649]MDF5757744.1 HAD family phosphatase [Spongiactinospora sp. TRM90649]
MSWVWVDFGGVICEPPGERESAALMRAVGTEGEAFWEVYWERRKDYDLGLVDAAGYWGQVCGRLGRTAGPALLDELLALDLAMWMYLNPGTMAVLTELADRRVPLALLSNAPPEMARLIDGQPWAARFAHRFFSADLRRAKPDPRVYQEVCERLGAEPGEVVFIDDRAENVEAARELGIEGVLFTDAERLRADLATVYSI